MREKTKVILIRMLCLMLAFGMGASPVTAYAVSKETQAEIDRIKKEKEEAERAKRAAEQQKGNLNSQKSNMEKYMKDLENQAKSLNEQISILESDITAREEEIAQKEVELVEAQEEVDRQYEDMKKRIQYMYENGQGNVLNYMSAALTDGLTDMLNRAEYAMDINQYDRSMLNSYKEAKAELQRQQQELQEEQETLEKMKEEAEKKKVEVANQQKATSSKLSEFDDLLAQAINELSSKEEIVAEKTRILNQLIQKAANEEQQARLAAAQQAASSMNGGYIISADAKIDRSPKSLSEYEIMLLACMIYCEAGNQGWDGQTAVGYVIMNRVRSALYPNSLEAVLRQSKQFEPAGSGRFDLVLRAEQDDDIRNIVTQSCWDAARTVVNGSSNVGDSLFFRTWKPVPTLVENLKAGGVPYWIIKDHIFYYYWTSYSTKPKPSEPDDKDDDDDDEEEPRKPDPQPEQPKEPDPQPDPKPDPQPDPQPDPKPEPDPDPKPDPEPDPGETTDPTSPTDPDQTEGEGNEGEEGSA